MGSVSNISLTPKRERFVQEYLIDLNGSAAAIRAGYSERTARSQGQRLLTNADIQAAVQVAMADRAEKTGVDTEYVVTNLKEIVEKTMAKGDYANANRALDLLGRPMPSSQAGLITGLLGQVVRQLLHRLWPKRFLGRSKDTADVLTASRLYEHLLQIFYHRNESVGVLYTVLQQLNRAEEAPPSPQLARAYASTSGAAGIATLHKLAEEYVRLANQALPVATQLSDQGLVDEYIGTS